MNKLKELLKRLFSKNKTVNPVVIDQNDHTIGRYAKATSEGKDPLIQELTGVLQQRNEATTREIKKENPNLERLSKLSLDSDQSRNSELFPAMEPYGDNDGIRTSKILKRPEEIEALKQLEEAKKTVKKADITLDIAKNRKGFFKKTEQKKLENLQNNYKEAIGEFGDHMSAFKGELTKSTNDQELQNGLAYLERAENLNGIRELKPENFQESREIKPKKEKKRKRKKKKNRRLSQW